MLVFLFQDKIDVFTNAKIITLLYSPCRYKKRKNELVKLEYMVLRYLSNLCEKYQYLYSFTFICVCGFDRELDLGC